MIRLLCYFLLPFLVLGCTSGLTPPDGLVLTHYTRRPYQCQKDYRHCAIETINLFLRKVERRDLRDLPLATNYKFTQNTRSLSVGDGFFKEAVKFAKKRFYVDTFAQEAMLFCFFEADDQTNANFTGRFKVIETAPGMYGINELEILSGFSLLSENSYPGEDPYKLLDISHRLPRHELISLANKYYDGIEGSSSGKVPSHDNVLRSENGLFYSIGRFFKGFQMKTLLPMVIGVRERHIIADQEKGVVMANVVLDFGVGTMRSSAVPIAEIFEIDRDDKRDIESLLPTGTFDTTSGWDRQ